MGKALLLVTLLCVLASATLLSPQVESDVHRTLDMGVKGDVIVVPKGGFVSTDSAVVLSDDVACGVSIPSVALSDIIAHGIGVSPANVAVSSPFFPSGLALRKRRRNALFIVPSIPSSLRSSLRSSRSSSCAHSLTSPLVLQSNWETLTSLSLSAVTLQLDQQSVVVSQSLDPLVRARISPRNDIAIEESSSFSRLARVLGARVSSDRVTLVASAGRSADFMLSNPVESKFLQELELALTTVSSFMVHPNAHNKVPHMLTFAFSSLEALALTDASKLEVAAHATDLVISDSLDRLRSDDANMQWQVVFLDQLLPILQESKIVDAISAQLTAAGVIVRDGKLYSTANSDVCTLLNKEIFAKDLIALCKSASVNHARAARVVVEAAGGDETITFQDVVAFQMLFWIGVGLFLIFLVGVTLVSTIGIPSESPLLRNLPDIYKNPTGTVIMRELGVE